MSKNGWIAVDLDGTLAHYEGWKSVEHIGDPIPAMANRIRRWLESGRDVRIFTARVDGGAVALSMGNEAGKQFENVEYVRTLIQDWTERHFGLRLPVTNVKDYAMLELWDDRAVRVVMNTGEPCCGHERKSANESAMSVDRCRETIAAMLPWALIGLSEDHPAVRHARELGITNLIAASNAELAEALKEELNS